MFDGAHNTCAYTKQQLWFTDCLLTEECQQFLWGSASCADGRGTATTSWVFHTQDRLGQYFNVACNILNRGRYVRVWVCWPSRTCQVGMIAYLTFFKFYVSICAHLAIKRDVNCDKEPLVKGYLIPLYKEGALVLVPDRVILNSEMRIPLIRYHCRHCIVSYPDPAQEKRVWSDPLGFTHAHTHAHTLTCTHAHSHTHMHTHTHTHTYTHTHTHTHMHTHTHAHTHSHTHTHLHTHTHMHTHSPAHTHAHAHTRTHTHTTHTHTSS